MVALTEIIEIKRLSLYNKAGKKLYDSGDDPEGDWGYVNASDPLGTVGEYLGEIDRKAIRDSY